LPEVAAQVGLQVDAPPLKHRQCTLSLQTFEDEEDRVLAAAAAAVKL
jgi:hypothetical protein